MLTSSCLGYFGMRALLPLTVQILAQTGLAKNRRGETVTLTRPDLELPAFLGSIAALLMFAYIYYLDPAIQSNHYITHHCEHWAGTNSWAPAGTFITTWYSERWGAGRYAAQYLGLIMLLLSLFPFIYSLLAFFFAYKLRKKKKEDKNQWGRRELGGFFALFVFVVLSLGLFAGIAQKSGEEYHVVASAGGETTREARRLGNDCIAAVYAAFWLSAFIGHTRARWALDAMSKFFKGVWIAGGFLFALIPIIQTPILIGRDLWEGKTSDGMDVSSERTTMVVFLYIALAGQVLVFGFLGFGFYKSTPDDPSDATAKLEEAKEDGQDILDAMQENNKIENLEESFSNAPYSRPEIQKLMQMNIAVPQQHLPLNLMTGASAGRQPRDARALFAHDRQALSVCGSKTPFPVKHTHVPLTTRPSVRACAACGFCDNFHKGVCTCPSRRRVRLGYSQERCND